MKIRYRFIASDGYVLIYMPKHPHADANGNIREHRLKAEIAIGRVLDRVHPVHHHDENTANNENANLVICEDIEYHAILHRRAHVLRAGGDPNSQRWCVGCQAPRDAVDFNRDGYQKDGLARICRPCSRAKDRLWHDSNPDKVKAKHTSYHSRNRDRINARKREMRAAGKWGAS